MVTCRGLVFYLYKTIASIYTVPVGIIQAITNQQIAINVIAELIAGYALPGRPVALMVFKVCVPHIFEKNNHF